MNSQPSVMIIKLLALGQEAQGRKVLNILPVVVERDKDSDAT
ncbi:hypothetical protein [Nostoc sp. 'Lobaria pulmonaria (5183) cyanobiont']|nr:hypothetical protein [Nostoc sp. 'Lobaria pulmonaria (5183) cyanobiont']